MGPSGANELLVKGLDPTAVEEEGVERLRAADERPVLRQAAEGHVCDAGGHMDLAEELALRADAVHPVRRARPKLAVLVDPETVGVARLDLVEHAAVRERDAVGGDIEDANVLARIGFRLIPCLGDVEAPLVGREGPATTRMSPVAGSNR
jgi:hypothetical protein